MSTIEKSTVATSSVVSLILNIEEVFIFGDSLRYLEELSEKNIIDRNNLDKLNRLRKKLFDALTEAKVKELQENMSKEEKDFIELLQNTPA